MPPRFSPEVVAGMIGLIAALGIGGMRVFSIAFGGSGPFNPLSFREEIFGSIVLLLILASPYVAALLSTRLSAGTRWAVLLPASLLSLTTVGIGIASIGIFFLPTVVVLFIAAGSSIGQRQIPRSASILIVVVALAALATITGALFSLFQTHDARGWVYQTFPDGHIEWVSVPQTPGHLGSGLIQDPSGGKWGFRGTSNIITNTEAANSAALLLLAWVEIGVLGVYAKRRWPDPPEQSSDSNAIPTLPNSS